MIEILPHHTFHDKRFCPCGQRIPDQLHKAIKYCPPFFDDVGRKVVHKDLYNADGKKVSNEPYKSIMEFHKLMTRNLSNLWSAKSPVTNSVIVTISELSAYRINPYAPMKFQFKNDDKLVLYFVGYSLDQIDSSTFKLFKYG